MDAYKSFSTGEQSKSVALYTPSKFKASCAYFVTARLLVSVSEVRLRQVLHRNLDPWEKAFILKLVDGKHLPCAASSQRVSSSCATPAADL